MDKYLFKKGGFILGLFFIASLVITTACEKCADHFEHVDIQSVEMVPNFENVPLDKDLVMRIDPLDIQFTAYEPSINLFSNAYAITDCPDNGGQGMTKKVIEFDIKTTAPFNDSIAAGESMIQFFELGEWDEEAGIYNYFNIDNYLSENIELDLFLNRFALKLTERPTLNSAHFFILTLKLEDGSEITGKSKGEVDIIWE